MKLPDTLCNAPLLSTEVRCQLPAGHAGGSCWSKYRMEYPSGVVSYGQMWWASPGNLPTQATENKGEIACQPQAQS